MLLAAAVSSSTSEQDLRHMCKALQPSTILATILRVLYSLPHSAATSLPMCSVGMAARRSPGRRCSGSTPRRLYGGLARAALTRMPTWPLLWGREEPGRPATSPLWMGRCNSSTYVSVHPLMALVSAYAQSPILVIWEGRHGQQN